MFSKYRILIFSENPDELMRFYRDVLGLKLLNKLDIPNDYGYMFEVSGQMWLWIGKHSNVHGQNQDADRHIFNLYTDDVQKWYEKIKAKKAEIILPPTLTPFATPENPIYVCTFLDPERNTWQFMGKLQNS
jgi:uncharacterized glyoxalase superfamily protein PhnB